MSVLKELGDAAFKSNRLRQAIEFYTIALETPPQLEFPSVEQQRVLLSNRSQAYLVFGEIYTALKDCDLLLSPRYTKENSPSALTAKCFYRRAHLRYKMTFYDDALNDYRSFECLQNEMGRTITPENTRLRCNIEAALRIPKNSVEMERIMLIRAVQARGIMLADDNRSIFPAGPAGKDDETEYTCFDPIEDGPTTDNTPLSILFVVHAPFLPSATSSSSIVRGPWVRGREPYMIVNTMMPENTTVGEHIQGLFTAVGMHYPNTAPGWMREAFKYESWNTCKIILITASSGRMFVIPHAMKVKDIWPGVRWPRVDPFPFEDLRPLPRRRPHEVDGPDFAFGHHLDLQVIPNEYLNEFIEQRDLLFKKMYAY